MGSENGIARAMPRGHRRRFDAAKMNDLAARSLDGRLAPLPCRIDDVSTSRCSTRDRTLFGAGICIPVLNVSEGVLREAIGQR